MRIRRLILTVLAVVLLSSINIDAFENRDANREFDDRENLNSTRISMTLKMEGGTFKDEADNIREPSTSVSSSPIANGSRMNGSRELILPNGTEIAKVIADDVVEEEEETPEELPEAQELKIVRMNGRRRPIYRPPPRRPTALNRRNVFTDLQGGTMMRPPRRPTDSKRGPTEKECTFFSKTVCLEAVDYPHEAILRSLRGNKEMVSALLSDYKTQDYGEADESFAVALPLESKFENQYENRYENRYENNEIKRRSDSSSAFENVEEGFTCPSTVKYARPQLARAASGAWKYIINTGEHTQTLRLEKCSNPQSSCSFISENYRSSCVQVYNYHRLLTWDSKLGLHMDIFKVPTCCSCHVHGYAEIFPPHQKDPAPKPKESFPGADFATTHAQKDDFQDVSRPSYFNKFTTNFDSSIVSSNKKPVVEITASRPTFTLPVRTRPKKHPTISRPFDKLPQQHAPNTRAPGYTGPLLKPSRPNRSNRPPFRRESSGYHPEDFAESSNNSTIINRYSQPYDQDMDATSRLQNGGFDEEYQEPQRRINYNYHPIIDFFKPEASMLQADSQLATHQALQSDSNSWKPVISS